MAMRNLKNIPLAELDINLDDLDSDCFLNSEKRLFPVKNADGTYNLNLIRLAVSRTAQYGYKKENDKALALTKLFSDDVSDIPDVRGFAFRLSEDKVEYDEDSNGFWYLALPLGTFTYMSFWGAEEVHITQGLCEDLSRNFARGYPHYGVPVKTGHGNDPKWGDVDKVEATEEGLRLHNAIFDDKFDRIKNKEYEFMSLEYTEVYTEKENGNNVGPTVLGVALTNQPAHPKVPRIQMSETVEKPSNIKQLADQNDPEWNYCQLSDKKIKDKEVIVTMNEEEIKALQEQNKTLAEQNKQLADSIKAQKVEAYSNRAKAFSENLIAKGIAPALATKVCDYVVAMSEVNISLGEDKGTIDAVKMFEDIFDDVKTIQLSQIGSTEADEDKDAKKKEFSERVENLKERINSKMNSRYNRK